MKIPRQLYLQLQKIVEDTGFSSVNELIVFVMRTMVVDSEGTITEESLRSLRKKFAKLVLPKDIQQTTGSVKKS